MMLTEEFKTEITEHIHKWSGPDVSRVSSFRRRWFESRELKVYLGVEFKSTATYAEYQRTRLSNVRICISISNVEALVKHVGHYRELLDLVLACNLPVVIVSMITPELMPMYERRGFKILHNYAEASPDLIWLPPISSKYAVPKPEESKTHEEIQPGV